MSAVVLHLCFHLGADYPLQPLQYLLVLNLQLVEEGKHLFIQFIYVIDMSGRKITENVTQPMYREKYGTFGLNEDFSERDWFKGALAEEGVYITDFYKSRITGALCITVSAPIRDERGDWVGVIGADLKFEELARVL